MTSEAVAVKSATDEVRGIRRHDLWRWQAELYATARALDDQHLPGQSATIASIAAELAVLACPEADDD